MYSPTGHIHLSTGWMNWSMRHESKGAKFLPLDIFFLGCHWKTQPHGEWGFILQTAWSRKSLTGLLSSFSCFQIQGSWPGVTIMVLLWKRLVKASSPLCHGVTANSVYEAFGRCCLWGKGFHQINTKCMAAWFCASQPPELKSNKSLMFLRFRWLQTLELSLSEDSYLLHNQSNEALGFFPSILDLLLLFIL